MSWVEDVAGILLAAPALSPVAPVAGTNLGVGRLPTNPDTLYAILPYPGRPNERTHSGGARRFARFQVVCRNPDPEAADEMAEAVYRRLAGFLQTDIGGITYERIIPLQEPFPLNTDPMARANVGCNYECWYQTEAL